MSETVNINDCKTNFSELLNRVKQGEEIIISNQDVPIAKLVPYPAKLSRKDTLGMDEGKFIVPDDFNDPLFMEDGLTPCNVWGHSTQKIAIQEAVEKMRQLQQDVALDQESIKNMIEEGRRF